MTSSPRSKSAADALGPDAIELLRLVEQDLVRHESTINEHHRTSLTIRGLALTAVAGLVGGGYASFVPLPDYFAVGAAALFLWADYYYSRLYTGVEQRLRVLESLSTEYRRLLARPGRVQDDLDDFRGDLRAYSTGRVAPDARPRLWPVGSLGRLKVFLPLYLALAVVAALSGWYVATHRKPGAANGTTIVCIGRAPAPSPQTAEIVPCTDISGLGRIP
jgi:hypothetical protein